MTYIKTITPVYSEIPEQIKFEKKEFREHKTEQISLEELEFLDVYDINRFKK